MQPEFEGSCERAARLAARLLGAPLARVEVRAGPVRISTSSAGPGGRDGSGAAPDGASLCSYVATSGAPLVVDDARTWRPTGDDPPVAVPEEIGAFLGVPLQLDGSTVGALGVLDSRPRTWSDEDLDDLLGLGRALAAQLELRREQALRCRLEERVREQEARFRAVTESALEVVTVLSADGSVRYQSPSTATILGYPPKALVGRQLVELVHPDDAEGAAGALAEIRATPGRAQLIEFRFRHADGSWRDLEVLAENYLDDPVIRGIVTHSRDTTRRQTAENALRESEERFRQLAAGAREVFWMFDTGDMRVLYVSPSYDRLFGKSAAEFYENPGACLEAVVPRDRARMTEFFQGVRDGPRTEVVEIERPDGEHRWVEVRGFPVCDDDGTVYRIAGTSEDITERRSAEAEIRRAKQDAERANRAKSEFLSRMSHELRTPMNSILGFAQVLEMDVVEPQDQESVQQILRAGRHLLRLIDEVLDLARIESEQIALSLEPVRVEDAVTETLELVRALARQRDVSLRVQPCDHAVMADHQRLKQVLLNLLSNGIKYNREGGTVTVSCGEVAGGRLRVRVSDTGPGLTAAQISRIFLPFDRLGAEQSGIPGTGLGLSLSKGLAEAMGGVLGIESVPGEGSTFWVELPTTDTAERAEERAASSEIRARAVRPGAAVLYIEDNLANLRLVERILAKRPGVVLIPAMQGRIGLNLARERRPDLILLDVHLPDMMGDEVLAELQKDPTLARVPVVAISADATERQRARLLDAGAREYLTKPIDAQLFLGVVDAALSARAPDE